jgi:hypothetical protein
MFDFFIELAFSFTHHGTVTPFGGGEPIPWGPGHHI